MTSVQGVMSVVCDPLHQVAVALCFYTASAAVAAVCQCPVRCCPAHPIATCVTEMPIDVCSGCGVPVPYIVLSCTLFCHICCMYLAVDAVCQLPVLFCTNSSATCIFKLCVLHIL